MYAHMNHTMIHALEAARRDAAIRPIPKPARAAPVPGALRLAIGTALVRVGSRLAPETGPVTAVADNPC